MRTHVATKWDFLFIAIGFFLVIYPHMQIILIWKIPAQQSMNPTYWNGLTAYLAIVFALVTGIVVTRRNELLLGLVMMILLNWALVLPAADSMFGSALGKASDVRTVAWVMGAFLATHWTAGGLIVWRVWPRKIR